MKEKSQVIQWIKGHKKQLLIAGLGIAALIAVILAIKNKNALKAFWSSIKKVTETSAETITDTASAVSEVSSDTSTALSNTEKCVPQEVGRHIRNLHEGGHASADKIALAKEHNIVLKEGQTWVEAYTKGGSAA